MNIDVEVILYQILIILIPMVVYHLFFQGKSWGRKQTNTNLTIILLFILLLSMSFPMKFSEGYIYDFRIIPLIISFIYGGTIPGLITFSVLITYRLIIGGGGFYSVLIVYSLTSGFLVLWRNKVKLFSMGKKLVFVSLVFWANTLMVMLTLLKTDQSDKFPLIIIFYTVTWLCLVMVIFVIENINQQINLREKFKNDEKLNVISQLAASVAHEVRNPLTSVRGFLQLISDDDNLKSAQKNYIGIALNELDHAQSIINDYLSLARPNTEDLSCINLSEEVQKTIALMTSYSNIQNITIGMNIQESLYIKGNKGEIKQVLVNIIKNGIEAMKMGGTLTINTFEKCEMVTIEIIDSGKGMTRSQLKKLGTPFYTTKEKGTGVGLTISFQLISAMKGRINVKSELGKGTVFTIEFPRVTFLEDQIN